MPLHASETPRQILQRFYDAEGAYMKAGGAAGGASFDAIAATLAPTVLLHHRRISPSVENMLATSNTASGQPP